MENHVSLRDHRGYGRYLPPIEVDNDQERKRFVDLPDFVDKMEEATGIRKRWQAPDDWSTSDVALPAAKQALERYTGSACIGMALDDAVEKVKVHPGDLVVLVGSGVGYNQAGVAFRMT